MSQTRSLQVVQVNATLRGDDPDRPVQVGTDGTRVVILADTTHAELLARMIARVTGDLRDVDDVDPALWDHVTVDLLCAKAIAGADILVTPNEATPLLEVVR